MHFASILPAERVEDLPKPTDYVSDLCPCTLAGGGCPAGPHLQPARPRRRQCADRHRDGTYLDGEDAADWASELENKWHMGKKGSDRGVLVLLAVNDHKRRIDVGYGLEGILPDGKVGDIGREMVPSLRANDYDGAVISGGQRNCAGDCRRCQRQLCRTRIWARQPRSGTRGRRARRRISVGGIIFILIILLFFGGFRFLAFLFGWNLLTGGYRGGRSGAAAGGAAAAGAAGEAAEAAEGLVALAAAISAAAEPEATGKFSNLLSRVRSGGPEENVLYASWSCGFAGSDRVLVLAGLFVLAAL